MNTENERTPRSANRRMQNREEYADGPSSSAPRRRRSQATRLQMEEDGMNDTFVRSTLETPGQRRQSARTRTEDAGENSGRYRGDGYKKGTYAGRSDTQEDMPFAEEYDDYGNEEDSSGEAPSKKRRAVRWAIIVFVILLILAGITYVGLKRPDFVEPVIKWGRELINGADPTAEPTPEPTPEPTLEPAPNKSSAIVYSFQASTTEQANPDEPIVFSVITTLQTDRIQIIDKNGQTLIEGMEGDYVDAEYGREWTLAIYFPDSYEGSVEVSPGNEDGWNDASGQVLTVQVGSAQETDPPEGGDIGTADIGENPDIVNVFADVSASSIGTVTVDLTTDILTPAGNSVDTLDSFAREKGIALGDADAYGGANGMNGVLAFRGSGMRQNAAFGVLSPTELTMEKIWSADVGSQGSGASTWGVQPLIVQWHADIRKLMNLNESKIEKSMLKEVIFASGDGSVYFFDLDDGQATRAAMQIDPALPMLSAAAVYPSGVPMLAVGSGDPSNTSSENSGSMLVYSLIDFKRLGFISGNNENALSSDTAFITSPLFALETDSLVTVGGNGLLYTLKLGTDFSLSDKTLKLVNVTSEYYRSLADEENVSVDSALASYGEFAYFASKGGILQCVNLNTLEPVWALDIGADTDAAVTLDVDEVSGEVALYTASKDGADGYARLRRIDAATGDVVWDVTAAGSVSASPLLGAGEISDMVFFTVGNTEGGAALAALDKETGTVLWQYMLSNATSSSPIALYAESGAAWIVQADGSNLQLIEPLTGDLISSLALEDAVIGSPVAFDDLVVVATQNGRLHGIQIK